MHVLHPPHYKMQGNTAGRGLFNRGQEPTPSASPACTVTTVVQQQDKQNILAKVYA
jgi:hypothetical protein